MQETWKKKNEREVVEEHEAFWKQQPQVVETPQMPKEMVIKRKATLKKEEQAKKSEVDLFEEFGLQTVA